MKRILTTLSVALFSFFFSHAQFSTVHTITDATCWNSNDGSYLVDSISACFAPITIQVDTNTITFQTLTNNGYTFINHGAGDGNDEALDVWAGQTSTGPVYIATGIFTTSLQFDTTFLAAGAPQDMFVACFDANTSALMWVVSGSTPGDFTSGFGVTGADNKAYVTGYLNGTCQIGNSSITSTGGYQAYIAKIDIPTGSVDTIIEVGGAGDEEGRALHYAEGRIYLGGGFTGTTSLAGNSFASNGSYDAFVLCLDTSLSTTYWAATGGGSQLDLIDDVVTFENNGVTEAIYTVGTMNGASTFGANNLTSAGSQDYFIATIDTLGGWGWAMSGGGSSLDFCTTIDVNSTGDRLYVGGSWSGTMTLDGQSFSSTGSDDGFIAYLSAATGSLQNFYPFAGSGTEFISDLKSVDDDYLVFVGRFNGSLIYADSTFVSNGNQDAFIGKIGEQFHEIWGKNFGGTLADRFARLHLGPDQRVHTAGYFQLDASQYQPGLIAPGANALDVVITNGLYTGLIDTSFSQSGLSAGQYFIQFSDSNGNVWIDTITVGAPDSLTFSASIVNATSAIANDGSIDLTVTGGTPGYTYLWSNGATTEDISSLTSGNYCVTVTDTNGCLDSTCFFVDSSVVTVPMVVTNNISNLSCFGDSSGAIDLTVTGGVPPYAFAWSTGATSEDLSGLSGGLYMVTITDNDTSVYVDSFNVSEPSEIVIGGVITPPSSGTANDGAIDLSVSGGEAPYSFLWSNSETSEDITGLSIGNYTVTVTDSAGCFNTRSFFVDTIAALNLVSVATDVTCINTNNGTIDLTIIGGVPPFSIAWSNGATTEDVSGLAAGTYSVTVTDSVAQTATLSDTISSNPIFDDPIAGPISGPSSVQAWTNYNYSVPSSAGSSFDWVLSGGLLINAASNASLVHWNAGPTGKIYVYETDANGCIGSDSLDVTILFVGIDESNENSIAVFPNPVKDYLQIRLPESFANPAISVIDMQGRIVLIEPSSSRSITLDLSDLKTGNYILLMQKDETVIHHKIVVE